MIATFIAAVSAGCAHMNFASTGKYHAFNLSSLRCLLFGAPSVCNGTRYTASIPLETSDMRDLIPYRSPSNSWRGFFLRVATIAIAAVIILGIINLFGYLQSPTPAPSLQPTHPSSETNP